MGKENVKLTGVPETMLIPLRAGFRSVRSKKVDTDWGEEDIDIGRK